MPNPFPGMNPYLENPRRWRMVHSGLIYGFNAVLAERLPPEFITTTDERVYVEGWDKEYVPDAVVIQTRPVPLTDAPPAQGRTTLLDRPTPTGTSSPPTILDFGNTTTREQFIEIRTNDEQEELVAVVEFLSPTNKIEGPGREEYRRKQRDLLASGVHLMEIDLLRGGAYTVAPEETRTRARVGHFDYLISLHDGGTGNRFTLWHPTLRERLPEIWVPLIDDVAPVSIDLQAVLNEVYDRAGHDRWIRYNEEPSPPLSPDDVIWADALLREKGLR